MDTGKAIFFGLALIALAIFTSDALRPANAGIMGSGRYMGVRAGNLPAAVWIVDTENGASQLCFSQKIGGKPKGCQG
jgi:hypothetical protein